MRILDTDVCIEILRGNRRVMRHRQAVLDDVVTTWMTAAELFYGAAKSKTPLVNRELVTAFLATLRVVGLDHEAVEHFGVLKAHLEQQGQRLADVDLCQSDLQPFTLPAAPRPIPPLRASVR